MTSSATNETDSTQDARVLRRIVRERRTNLRIDTTRNVDDAIIIELCQLASWAPNHKLTQPWRFAVVRGRARGTLGQLAADHQKSVGDDDPARLEKTRTKYLRAPVIVIVASGSDAAIGSSRRAEDRDAVSAGIQNLLLGATAAGLNSYWSTGVFTSAPLVKEFAGLRPEDDIVAGVYLGWPLGPVPVPERRTPVIRWLGD